jgi:methionine-rich copper-binding protein CopC
MLRRSLACLALTLPMVLGGALVAPAHDAELHFALTRSAPEAESHVAEVHEIRLWFTQVPQENSVSVRLVDASGAAMETGELQSDPADGKIVFVALDGTPPVGAYTVAWRGIGDDGHVVRGEFPFTVDAQ